MKITLIVAVMISLTISVVWTQSLANSCQTSIERNALNDIYLGSCDDNFYRTLRDNQTGETYRKDVDPLPFSGTLTYDQEGRYEWIAEPRNNLYLYNFIKTTLVVMPISAAGYWLIQRRRHKNS